MCPKTLNLLLVDDDELDVLTVRRAARKGGVRATIYVAHDGPTALSMLHENEVPPNRRIVLLDLNMPRMNGLEFLREIRQDEDLSPTPVVVLTTSNDARDMAAAYQLHAAGYLVKPVSFRDMVEVLAALDAYWSRVELP
jgi:CheY-like chemotaxis protein